MYCVRVVKVRGFRFFASFLFVYLFRLPSNRTSWSIHFISPNPIREVEKSHGKNVEMVK